MLSDEEKQAMECLKLVSNVATNKYTMKEQLHLKTILNLIEKQSKEIEELKEDKYGLEEEVQIQAKQLIEIDGNYISKEESEQKEKQAYIDGTNAADKLCNKKWEDKIKAKIEELDEKLEYETNGWESEYEYTKEVLQSLLEKE